MPELKINLIHPEVKVQSINGNDPIIIKDDNRKEINKLIEVINNLKENGLDNSFIKKNILPSLGYKKLPKEILEIL